MTLLSRALDGSASWPRPNLAEMRMHDPSTLSLYPLEAIPVIAD